MMSGLRICLFGGTFDPVHAAHLKIAEEAAKNFSLDRVLFVPAANPPHKTSGGLAAYEDRFRMVELACAPYTTFEASRLEESSEPSYTIDTLERFKKTLRPEDKLLFLIGSDAFDELETWRRWQDVVKLTEFIVVRRPGGHYHVAENAQVHRLDDLDLPAASRTIRARLSAGEPTPELPAEIRSYIEQRGLYETRKGSPIASRSHNTDRKLPSGA
jgi:nicotinate-nucleotide adenylyltransferase